MQIEQFKMPSIHKFVDHKNLWLFVVLLFLVCKMRNIKIYQTTKIHTKHTAMLGSDVYTKVNAHWSLIK